MPWSLDSKRSGFTTARIKDACMLYIQALCRASEIAHDEIPSVRIDWNINRDTPRVDFWWL
jgi:hypothetical protein